MRQWYAFRLMERENECHTLLHSKRLFQQFLVDSYTTVESNRLRYLRMNQKYLRSDSFDSIKQAENDGKIDMHEQGSRFLLPASFTGGPRYMKICIWMQWRFANILGFLIYLSPLLAILSGLK